MPSHPFRLPKGEIANIIVESKSLSKNLLGDPSSRSVAVYLPPEYNCTELRFPLLVYLASYGGSGLGQVAWRPFEENLLQRIDRLQENSLIGPMVVALPDCFTSLGGNQYVNSVAMGDWEDFLLQDMLPALESSFRILEGPTHRAVIGFSSGGYGALLQGLCYGSCWAAAACHSGDMGFELVYARDFPMVANALARHQGSPENLLRGLENRRRPTGSDRAILMMLAMGASYDPDPSALKGVSVPFDSFTCDLIPERWNRWLGKDPVRLIDEEDCQKSLRKLSGLYLDCGNRDDYYLHFGARRFTQKLETAEIPHQYEEFEDGHRHLAYRLDTSLAYLYPLISP